MHIVTGENAQVRVPFTMIAPVCDILPQHAWMIHTILIRFEDPRSHTAYIDNV